MATNRMKIILGVDYGTTFTGVSYVTSDKTSVDDIDVFRTWPGEGRPLEGNWKTPSIIAYGIENKRHANRNRWGYEVRRDMEACSWTKLLLDTSAETAEFDDPSLRDAAGSAIFRIPPGKDAQMVCRDFLAELYRFVVNNLQMRITPEIFALTPMECYLTVPAIWTDKAKSATREAARAAGFGSRKGDSIFMVPEPEAAAVAALRKDLRPGSVNAVKTGDNILVVDCGGGTVDMTAYSVQRTFPKVEFGEICVGAGGKCGSTHIDRNFLQLMHKRFGKAFEEVPHRRKGPGSEFMASFERVKQGFGAAGFGISDDEYFEVHPINMEGDLNPDHYDEDEAAVILSKSDMEELFNPVIDRILGLVEQQVSFASDRRKPINLAILVGGFGNSDYLKKELDNWCGANGIRCIRPDFSQAAVVRGAAIRGLEVAIPTTLVCRRHYGISYSLPFNPLRDDEKHAHYIWEKKFCSGHMDWMIAKGSELTHSTQKSCSLDQLWTPSDGCILTSSLYSCALDNPAARREHSDVVRVGEIQMDISNVDKSHFEQRQVSGRMEYQLSYKVVIEFGSNEGVLNCFCVSEGKKIGVTTINFAELTR